MPPKEKRSTQENKEKNDENMTVSEGERQEATESLRIKLQLKQLEESSKREQREFEAQCRREEWEYELKRKEVEARKEIEIKRLEFERERIEGSQNEERMYAPRTNRIEERIAIPVIKDDVDIEDIISSFERMCRCYNVEREKWVFKLVPFLAGKAMKAYSRLSELEAQEYGTVKRAILQAFKITPEEHRLKFRKMQKNKEETYEQLAAKMKDSLRAWISGTGSEQDYEKLEELVCMEQFFRVIPDNLKIWLSDREPRSTIEAAKLADKYIEARDQCWKEKKESTRDSGEGESMKTKKVLTQEKISREDRFGNRYKEAIKCFKCNNLGHIAMQCPKNQRGKEFSGRNENRTCYSGITGRGWPKEYEVPIMVNNRWCKALRDTGANITVVSDSNVNEEDYTGREIAINTMMKGVCNIPMAKIEIEMQGHRRIAEVAVMRRLPIGAIIGNDLGEHLQPVKVRGGPGYGTSKRKEEYGYRISINDEMVTAIRDTGSNRTLVRPSLVRKEQYNGKKCKMKTVDGWDVNVPLAKVKIKDFDGRRDIEVGVVEGLPEEVLWGNDDGPVMRTPKCYMITTRGQEKRRQRDRQEMRKKQGNERKKKVVEGTEELKEKACWELTTPMEEVSTRAEMIQCQKEDEDIKNLKRKMMLPERGDVKEYQAKFYEEGGLVMREWKSLKQGGKVWKQLVIPRKLRMAVMKLAHGIELAGHLGIKKTRERVLQHFYWPGIFREVKSYVQSCPECQKTRRPGKRIKAPLQPIPIVGEPFFRIGIDLVGPLRVTERGNKYILVLVDYATKYPEATPLENIEAETIVRELVVLFTRIGFPREVVSDQGKQFIGQLAKGLWKRTGVKMNMTTPYHPQSNGLVESFNGTLKHMLRTLSNEYEKDWDEMIPYALFAYREVPQESTGFSPFELLYGRDVRGPLEIVKNTWMNDKEEKKNVVTYLTELRTRMKKILKTAREQMQKSQKEQKKWYDKKARTRRYEVGEEVLIISPRTKDTLEASWEGPYKITRKIGELNYEVRINERNDEGKIYHVNMLKKWKRRQANVGAIIEEDNEETEVEPRCSYEGIVKVKKDAKIGMELTEDKRKQMEELIGQYHEVFSEVPGRTNKEKHYIMLNNEERICKKAYTVPFGIKREIEKQIREMMEMGVIRESKSDFAAPVVLVPKKDGTRRFCVDYRELNKVTVTDAYPSPNVEEMMMEISEYQYLSKIDLAKGYWQIPMDEKAKHLTAFRVHCGLYEFNVMPFGLKNSAATFSRLMCKVLEGTKENIRCYMDDVLIGNEKWEDHLKDVGEVLSRLSDAGLRVKAEKCDFGAISVEFLGHKVSREGLQPQEVKIKVIREWQSPKNKKQVRAFLGITGYYRKYIENYAEITHPLTELLKKKRTNTVEWSGECQEVFELLKRRVTTAPILINPREDDEIILQTDASDKGIGAVVSVLRKNGEERPVAYLSRKLQPAEIGYSAIEKEALAIVFAIEKARLYVYGKKFTIETDHNPLTWMQQMKSKNRRILRWMLLMQEYDFVIRYKRGKLHGNADGLSRRHEE